MNQKSVLVLDDDYYVLRTVELFLTSRGAKVTVSHTTAEASEELQESDIDILLADFHIAVDEDGVKLARNALLTTPKLAVVIMSAERPSHFPPCRDFHCLQKPFGAQQLLEAIDVALAEARVRHSVETRQ